MNRKVIDESPKLKREGKIFVNGQIGRVNPDSDPELEKLLELAKKQVAGLWVPTKNREVRAALKAMSLAIENRLTFEAPEDQKIVFYKVKENGVRVKVGSIQSFKIERDGGGGVDVDQKISQMGLQPVVDFLTDQSWNIVVSGKSSYFRLLDFISPAFIKEANAEEIMAQMETIKQEVWFNNLSSYIRPAKGQSILGILAGGLSVYSQLHDQVQQQIDQATREFQAFYIHFGNKDIIHMYEHIRMLLSEELEGLWDRSFISTKKLTELEQLYIECAGSKPFGGVDKNLRDRMGDALKFYSKLPKVMQTKKMKTLHRIYTKMQEGVNRDKINDYLYTLAEFRTTAYERAQTLADWLADNKAELVELGNVRLPGRQTIKEALIECIKERAKTSRDYKRKVKADIYVPMDWEYSFHTSGQQAGEHLALFRKMIKEIGSK